MNGHDQDWQPGGPGGRQGRPAQQSGPPRKPPRWVQWTVVPLLVLVPIGYVIVSAEQSRDSGEDKEAAAAATTLTPGLPTTVQRRIYQMPIPDGATGIASLETNSWDTSSLYTQFTTTAGGLDTFLAKIGTSRIALAPGHVTISADDERKVGWDFAPGRGYAGVSLTQPGDKPDHDITVDLTDADAPVVYVVSTVGF